MKGDLHIHTSVSDGCVSPQELVRAAAESGLSFFAVTDHNTVDGIAQVEAGLSDDAGSFVRGVELSAQPPEGPEIHVLGYGVDPDNASLLAFCRDIIQRKIEQLREIVYRLRRDGVDAAGIAAPDEGAKHYPGRPAVARQLVRAGVVDSFSQAFWKFLGETAPTYVPMRMLEPQSCVEIIHEAGGLAVLAHPSIEIIDGWIAALSDAGLDGVEAYRPSLNGNAQLYVEKAAEHFRLLTTGGSDWHGRPSERPLGQFTVTARQLDDFFAALGDGRRPG
ncbi:MAG: PHP domain-containing protein [Candidatus Brocadiaceae bacterium]|nr:PHP domain-containing protein [Candidatus Brocadiaceae bacterium]